MLLDRELFMLKPGFLLTPNPDILTHTKGYSHVPHTPLRTSLCVCVCYLLMVNGCLACCCLGIPMMLGDARLGLPILLLLPAPTPPPALSPPMPPTSPAVCAVGPPTCWLWFSTLRVLIGRMPLHRHRGSLTEPLTLRFELQKT